MACLNTDYFVYMLYDRNRSIKKWVVLTTNSDQIEMS